MRAAVIGGGYMGGGMAQVFALHGIDCTLADLDGQAARASVQRLSQEAERFEADGLFPSGAVDLITRHVHPADSIEAAVQDADYVAEVVPEVWDIKVDALSRASEAASPSAVIGTNTSAIPIARLAEAVRGPERFLGVHWMNPAPFVPGVEIIPGPATSDHAVDVAEGLLASLGKLPVRVPDSPGFIASRLQYALLQEACRIVEEGGATPSQVDDVITSTFGFRLAFFGPFGIADMAGLDVYASGFATLAEAYGERFAPPEVLRASVAAGRTGLKAGGGLSELSTRDPDALASYRNRAYAALAALKAELGSAP